MTAHFIWAMPVALFSLWISAGAMSMHRRTASGFDLLGSFLFLVLAAFSIWAMVTL